MRIIGNIYWVPPIYTRHFKYLILEVSITSCFPHNMPNYLGTITPIPIFWWGVNWSPREATWLGSGKLAFEPGILAPGLYFGLLHDAASSLEGPKTRIVVSEVGGVVEVPGAVGAVSTVGGAPEVCSDATLLNLKHPSSAVLTCCVASGKALTSLSLGPIYKVGAVRVPISLCCQDNSVSTACKVLSSVLSVQGPAT